MFEVPDRSIEWIADSTNKTQYEYAMVYIDS